MVGVTTARSEGFTLADRDAMPEIPGGGRYELLEGVLVVSPAPSWRHQGIAVQLVVLLDAALTPGYHLGIAPLDVTLSGRTTLQPDVVIAFESSTTERGIDGPPALAVEIISPSTRTHDLVVKRRLLEEAGCPSYWVIDPGEPPTITAFELVDGAYVEVARVSGSESWTATRPFPVTIVPGELVDD